MTAENTDFRQETLDLENPFDVKLVRRFLANLDFDFQPEGVDYSMILYNLNDQIIGTGSTKNNVLKFVAVAPEFRESTAFAQVVTHLTDHVLKNNKTSFVFTRPENAVRFEGLGYKEISRAEPLMTVLEMGFSTITDYMDYLVAHKKVEKSNEVAALVMNCNPITLGHKYLIEKASKENKLVYLFVVEEDRSAFDFKTRWKLINKELESFSNVIPLKGSKYVVSNATFPSYFLKNENVDLITLKQAELDIRIFGEYFVPLLGIKKRYVGTETYCSTTAAYNNAMKEVLPEYGVEVIEIPRKFLGHDDNIISASKVRAAIKEDRLDEIIDFLPDSSRDFLLSEESNAIKSKIRESVGRH